MSARPVTARIDLQRLLGRIEALGRVGALPGGGVCRLALSDEDKAGRDLVCRWMVELGLTVRIDGIGNIVGTRAGRSDLPPVMIGSHIDSVRTGGLYDGCLGVLAGLEVAAALDEAGLATRRPLAVAVFTNEEGARFAPDMMGSLVFVGGLSLDEALATRGIDGETVGACLERIGYRGAALIPPAVHAYLELHIEQGPILEDEGIDIGVVEGVQGISWTELTIEGRSGHAGTTPIRLRRDAGLAAAEITVGLRAIADAVGGGQVATVGALALHPNLVNVIPARAVMTVDLRHPDEETLRSAEGRLAELVGAVERRHHVSISARRLARFAPVAFSPRIAARIEARAREAGWTTRRLHSGAGHDAQMLARVCPSGMIFVPSQGGLSHNVREFTRAEDIGRGAEVLLRVALDLTEDAEI